MIENTGIELRPGTTGASQLGPFLLSGCLDVQGSQTLEPIPFWDEPDTDDAGKSGVKARVVSARVVSGTPLFRRGIDPDLVDEAIQLLKWPASTATVAAPEKARVRRKMIKPGEDDGCN